MRKVKMKRYYESVSAESPTEKGLKNPFINEWEKEFKDEIYVTMEDGLQIRKNWYDLFSVLRGNHLFKEKIPVKIKCKKGCIQIERIGQ